MSVEIYNDGPLKGQASISVLINEQTVKWLQHASNETGYSLERLVEISTDEAALSYAKDNGLLVAREVAK